MRIYLDSCVFISLAKKEFGFNSRPLFVEAENFLLSSIKSRHEIVLSNLFFDEVKKKTKMPKESICGYFENIGADFSCHESEGFVDFRKFEDMGIHFPDSIHLALAVNLNCNCIVTFNVVDFENAEKIINIFLPSDFY